MKTKTQVTEVQRIATIFKLNPTEDNICLKINDIVKSKDSKIKKLEVVNGMLKAQIQNRDRKIINLNNEYAEYIDINEYLMLKKSYENLKKKYNKSIEENHHLNNIIEKYREEQFLDRLKKIQG